MPSRPDDRPVVTTHVTLACLMIASGRRDCIEGVRLGAKTARDWLGQHHPESAITQSHSILRRTVMARPHVW